MYKDRTLFLMLTLTFLLAAGSPEFKTSLGSEQAPIKAVLVFSDPANWYLDLQLITDVVTSGGRCISLNKKGPLPHLQIHSHASKSRMSPNFLYAVFNQGWILSLSIADN